MVIRFVYGGANVGLMEVLLRKPHVAGGLLLGIIPDFVKEKIWLVSTLMRFFCRQSCGKKKNDDGIC